MKVRARSNATMRAVAVTAWSLESGFRNIAAPRSFLESVVDDLLDRGVGMLPPRRRVLHHHKEHVLGAVDHDIAAGGAVPFELTQRARRDRCVEAGIDADTETVAEAKAVAGIVVDVA